MARQRRQDLVDQVKGNRQVTVTPEFRHAQQAMCYLVDSLTSHRLRLLFKDNTQAAAAMIGLLAERVQIENEREALEHIEPVMRILVSDKFRDIAIPEEQLAARFIIGRRSLYRMGDFGEVIDDEGPDAAAP